MINLTHCFRNMVLDIISLHLGLHKKNSFVERINKYLEELTITILNETSLPKFFYIDTINTTCYVLDRMLFRTIFKKTPYELYKDRKSNIGHLRVVKCKCFILNNGKENLTKNYQEECTCIKKISINE